MQKKGPLSTTFKGQLVTKKYTLSFVALSLVILGLLFLLYYFVVYDWLFQMFTFGLTGYGSLMLLVIPPLLLGIFLSSIIVKALYPKEVTISVLNEQLRIKYGQETITIIPSEVSKIVFVKSKNKFTAITINAQNIIKINVGKLFFGLESTALEQLMSHIKQLFIDQYQFNYWESPENQKLRSFTVSRDIQKAPVKREVFGGGYLLCRHFYIGSGRFNYCKITKEW